MRLMHSKALINRPNHHNVLLTTRDTTTHSIDIGQFFHLESVDPVYFNGTYYLAPDKGGEAAAISEPELKLAEQLIDQLAAERFDPNEYRDEFKERIKAAIQRQVAGKEVALAEAPVGRSTGNVIDLMEALRASLGARAVKPAPLARKPPKKAVDSPKKKVARR